MATFDELTEVVGTPVNSLAVVRLLAADGLESTSEPDLEEGEPPQGFLKAPASGYALKWQAGRITSAFLYVVPADGCQSFTGVLPGGLTGVSTRQDVRGRFGVAERSGEATSLPFLGRQGAWDRFRVGPVCVHFQYTEPDERIQQITLMAPDIAP